QCVELQTCDVSTCDGFACNPATGQCLTSCTTSDQCDDSYICDYFTQKCLQTVTCQNDGDCSGYACDNDDICRVSCWADRHCDEDNNYSCDSQTHTCVQ
ncbi:MAG: hypothetical protein JRH20_22850, partial [Deltaproteobacteria bacterium]|nr:hypothetical protein [Deltaproteobacteria bacterium]